MDLLYEAQESIFGPGEMLVEKWGKYMDIITEVAKSEGREMDDMTLMSTAICLENTERQFRRMDEATLAVNVGSFIHHGFDLITAVMPSLIANQVVSVQPQTRKTGEIFYLEFLYNTTKGNITSGDTMFGWQTAGNDNIWYSSDQVYQEAVGAGGAGTNFTGVNGMTPIIPGTVNITDGTQVVTDDGAGNLVGDIGVGTNTIDYSTGAFDVDLAADPGAGVNVVQTYRTDFEANPANIPEVNLQIQSIPVTANPRKLRARYSLDAAFDVSSAFGRSVGAELDVALASEIRQEIDGELLEHLRQNIGAGQITWNRTPGAGISFAEHKWTFCDALIEASNLIFSATRRAQGNFLVAGVGASNVIESLAPRFKPAGRVQPGPHYIGMLDDKKVFKNPYYPDAEITVGYKGDLFMEAGLVYAPYMPLFTTKPIMLDDFVTRKGLATSYAKKMVNNKFYSKLLITT